MLNYALNKFLAVKSQENGTSESSSPTQLQTQTQTKNSKDNHTDSKPSRSNKDTSNTNGQSSRKSKSDSKSKQKNSNSNSNSSTSETSEPQTFESKTEESANITPPQNSVFENDTHYLTNDLDELESDRHSLLENHDLLDNSDHSLLEDDTHNLLNDANNEVMMMQRHREMLAGLVDNNHLIPQMKSPLANGYGLLDRDSMYLANDRPLSQINHSLLDKEMLLRERSRSSMLLRQNEMLARQHNVMVEPKHYNMPAASIGLESASELLGKGFRLNHFLTKLTVFFVFFTLLFYILCD